MWKTRRTTAEEGGDGDGVRRVSPDSGLKGEKLSPSERKKQKKRKKKLKKEKREAFYKLQNGAF